MSFTEEQYLQSISENASVKKCFDQIKLACATLKEETSCPDEDIDEFLRFLIGKWK